MQRHFSHFKYFLKNIPKYGKQNYNRIWEKVEKLMRVGFESKPVCGDDDKYIKNKKNLCGCGLQIFTIKKFQIKNHHASVYQ